MKKKIKVSLAEKIICYYIKQLFPDIKETYSTDWLGKKEVDMFISSLNLVIEYDGQFYHQQISRDEKKDKLLLEHGLKVIRIREPECPILTDDSYNIITLFPRDDRTHVEPAIYELIEYINKEYGLELKIDVDVKRDLLKVIEQYSEYFDSEYYGRPNRTRDEKRKKAREKREQKEQKIVNLYKSGLTQEEIADRTKTSIPTIIKVLKKHNIKRKEERIRQIQEMKSKKFKQREVAEKLNISIATVKRYWNAKTV